MFISVSAKFRLSDMVYHLKLQPSIQCILDWGFKCCCEWMLLFQCEFLLQHFSCYSTVVERHAVYRSHIVPYLRGDFMQSCEDTGNDTLTVHMRNGAYLIFCFNISVLC